MSEVAENMLGTVAPTTRPLCLCLCMFVPALQSLAESPEKMQNKKLLPHAAELFAEAEVQAERTVALLRILIATGLGLVFVLAVLRAAPDGDAVLTRQWVFAGATMFAYFLLGTLSYIAIASGVYRLWMAWLAVTADSVFLLVNIWLGLINTGLAANYLISMPPIWLAPVVLAFGALRFNPLLQAYLILILIIGLFAIATSDAGWVSASDSPPPSVIGAFFALPPNVMRLAMLALAGVVLVIASIRARTLLNSAISEARRSFNLTRYLPKQIAERLAESGIEELRRGNRQNVAVLFVDIRGFTQQSERMSPRALSAFITEFRHRIAIAANASGGTIDKFIGDAAMVVFGLVPNERNDADAALKCADQILSEVEEWGKQRKSREQDSVTVGIGIHWGEAFCGVIGDETRLEYTVLGDTVNVAARLQELTKHMGWPILASGETLASAGASLNRRDWQELDSTMLRGRSGSILVYGSRGA